MTVTASETTTDTRVQAIFTDVLDSLLGIIRKHQVTWEQYRVAREWLTQAGNQGYEIYFEGDPYIDSDVVGAVKDSLVIALVRNGEAETRCSYDFVLTPGDNV